jgi:Zn finger protein HypA/HybF involved in hydrogenase expression
MTQEALKLALEALKEAQTNDDGMEKWDRNKKAIAALEKALSEHAMSEVQRLGQEIEQEPVQYKCTVIDDAHPNGIPLEQWAKPPQRTEQNFCPRCGKRTKDIHTCTPPKEGA